ncbi:uncharacterized protein LOC6576327 [Drosophila mojavensis]|uniref:DUF753 domain-containing protein n=2 Tax=mojavensis species complex TaxID=198037 RepID=B4KL99_DROMO|nr:uncharacterized protein LOC6576327 [Drosophila mojavensis]XP_017872903.1 PREDICTED: uncharacterized protein LOC108620506 [Drosophila arizonae]EDW11760.1 uncharacterized protein Dmoj_GI13368 [Drosophila mojavensis]
MKDYLCVLTVLAVFGWQLQLANSSCNLCQASNDVACINQTAYRMCFGRETPSQDQIFNCPDGLVCTDKPQICFQRSETPASCGDTDSCGRCNANNVFACTSRTTFAFCFGATTPTTVNGTCPVGRFCDASTADICVAKPTPNSIICHLD